MEIDENCMGDSIFKVPGVETRLKHRFFGKTGGVCGGDEQFPRGAGAYGSFSFVHCIQI